LILSPKPERRVLISCGLATISIDAYVPHQVRQSAEPGLSISSEIPVSRRLPHSHWSKTVTPRINTFVFRHCYCRSESCRILHFKVNVSICTPRILPGRFNGSGELVVGDIVEFKIQKQTGATAGPGIGAHDFGGPSRCKKLQGPILKTKPSFAQVLGQP